MVGVELHGLLAVLSRAQCLPGAQKCGWQEGGTWDYGTFYSMYTDPREELSLGLSEGCAFPKDICGVSRGCIEGGDTFPIQLNLRGFLSLQDCYGTPALPLLVSRWGVGRVVGSTLKIAAPPAQPALPCWSPLTVTH
jgi:hypothetical protein